MRFEFGEDEAVDVTARPGGVLYRRRLLGSDGLIRPVTPAGFEVDAFCFCDGGAGDARVRRSALHPLHQHVDLRVSQLALGGHFHVGVGVADRLDQQALVGIAGLDRGAAIAAFRPSLARVEEQVAFDLFAFFGVAFVTPFHEEWPDAFFEEVQVGSGGWSGGARGGRGPREAR